MINKALMSFVNDIDKNEKYINKLGIGVNQTSLITSFPRSGNGWIRTILSIFFCIIHKHYFFPEDIETLETFGIEKRNGKKTNTLGNRNKGYIPLDYVVPTIYDSISLDKCFSEIEDERIIKEKLVLNIFKTHHITKNSLGLKSNVLLLRSPFECIPSASLLMEKDLLEKSDDDIINILDIYAEAFAQYLTYFKGILNNNNTFVILTDEPLTGLFNWLTHGLKYSTGKTDTDIHELLSILLQKFPKRSAYNKSIHNRFDMSKLKNFSKANHLYQELLEHKKVKLNS